MKRELDGVIMEKNIAIVLTERRTFIILYKVSSYFWGETWKTTTQFKRL